MPPCHFRRWEVSLTNMSDMQDTSTMCHSVYMDIYACGFDVLFNWYTIIHPATHLLSLSLSLSHTHTHTQIYIYIYIYIYL